MTTSKPLSRSEMTIVNLLTSALAWGWPVLLSFVATPFIVLGLGNDAYGIRGLIISITGYFALLDLGLNGAVTKYLAEYKAMNDKALMAELLGTTLMTYAVLGMVGGTLIWFLADWFTKGLFSIPAQFYDESIWAFRLTGIGFFLSMITWWGSSIPTGLQRFDVFNGISIGFGTVTTLSTLAAVLLGYGLLGVVWANLLSNVIAIIAYWIAARKLLPEIRLRLSFEWKMFKRTVWFGFYMAAFRIFSLLFAQLDSILIGMWIGTAAITFYTVPQTVAQIVHGVNGKMMQIIFPMVSEFSALKDRAKIELLFVRGFNLSLVIGFAAAMPLFTVGEPLLRFWVSPEMASNASSVLQLLIIAFFLAGITAIPVNVLMGINCPQLVTLGAVVSGVLGALSYLVLIKPFGILGVAAGKLLGVTGTMIYYLAICYWKACYSFKSLSRVALRTTAVTMIVGLPAYYFVTPGISSLFGTISAALGIFTAYCTACWFFGIFDQEERRSMLTVSRKVFQSWL